ncbi:hypothetical protein [Plantactinospora soyae]|uniref:Uncharacterized protein n=1 Tax=Plantactinospora soyae TaxID=1544732 RepID=A0A927MGU3_9ACTN|nr:hypothetical protein [Plantactinospora soyae]MBE1492761.1 hypothetical protein [Plantactinospora soyae]
MIDQIRAADLPDGSVVSSTRTTYIKDHPSQTAAWRATRGGPQGDWDVDQALASGAEVLRVGDNSGQTIGRARWGDLSGPERAALDAWKRGNADTNGMLYAVRHALVAERNAAGPTLAPDARKCLARHLFLADRDDSDAEQDWLLSPYAEQEPYLRRADAILAVISGTAG